MLKNYLVVALRNLRKQPGYTFINVSGLALGFAAALVLFLYARHELSYDRFHERAGDIYQVYKERHTPTGVQETYETWVPLLDRLRREYPAVRNGARVLGAEVWVQRGEEKFREQVTYADPSLFEVFTFPLERGDEAAPLPGAHSVVLSPAAARKYFGARDPLGQVLTIDLTTDYVVTGVLREVPSNSSIAADLIVPFASAPWYAEEDTWDSASIDTYLLLADGARPDALEAQFPRLVASIWDAEVAGRTIFRLLPLADRHDVFTGSRRYAYILLGIGLAIVLIACINFMNLATARAFDRLREIGMRKVLGAVRRQLVLQFLGESVLMSLFALGVGLGLAQLCLPAFNALYGTDLRLQAEAMPQALGGALGLGLCVGLLAGAYPAFFLSAFRPLESLRGAYKKTARGSRLRRSLVVVQFALSIFLISGTAVVERQTRHMKDADVAFQKEHVVVLPLQLADFADPEDAARRLETFRAEIGRLREVASVTSSSHVPGDWDGWFTFAWPQGAEDEAPLRLRRASVDAAFFDTYAIPFVEGRAFIEGSEVDAEQAVILNEAARAAFGWETAVGKTVRRGDTEYRVVGVVRDYHYESLQSQVNPVLHFFRAPGDEVHRFVSARLRPGDYGGALAALRSQWEQLDPTRPLEYRFAEETFDALYRAQDRLTATAGAFSAIAILVACLGLFGLASLVSVQRTKEIGVRKVLGASVPGLVVLLSRDFARLVAVAFVLAAPAAYLVMNRWLDDFAYRISIGPGVFLLAGLLALVIAVATVSYQAIRVALTDPVESLRYE